MSEVADEIADEWMDRWMNERMSAIARWTNVLFLNVKNGGLTPNITDCFVANMVVVMVQWLTNPTSNQGIGGSIPIHGTYWVFFSFKKKQLVVRCYYFYIYFYR